MSSFNESLYAFEIVKENIKKLIAEARTIVPAYANSTYGNPYFDGETAYKYYNEFMWPVRYAQAFLKIIKNWRSFWTTS